MERGPAGARIILDVFQRGQTGNPLQKAESARRVGHILAYGFAQWLLRFHPDKMNRTEYRQAMVKVAQFEKDHPHWAVEISKDVGWPDENTSGSDSGDAGVQSVPPAAD
jgi:hypothetical protein